MKKCLYCDGTGDPAVDPKTIDYLPHRQGFPDHCEPCKGTGEVNDDRSFWASLEKPGLDELIAIVENSGIDRSDEIVKTIRERHRFKKGLEHLGYGMVEKSIQIIARGYIDLSNENPGVVRK